MIPKIILFLTQGKVETEKSTASSFLLTLSAAFLIGAICLIYLSEFLNSLGIIKVPPEKEVSYGEVYLLISAFAISPVIEELLFRYPLKFWKHKKLFLLYLHLSVVLFAAIHLLSFEVSDYSLLSCFFVILSPLFGGYLLSYSRLRYGFLFGLGIHIGYNLLCYIWDKTIGF